MTEPEQPVVAQPLRAAYVSVPDLPANPRRMCRRGCVENPDGTWSLCAWHEDKAQWAARETHRHDSAVCRGCAALAVEAVRPLDTSWNEAEAALPDGWVLDGYRRLYDEGHVTDRWVARAVEPTPNDRQPDGWSLPLIVGTATTPADALRALAANLSKFRALA